MFCTRCSDSRTPVGCGNEGRLALGLYDQTAENFGKGLFAHEFLHLGDGDEGFFEDVCISGGMSRIYYGIFVCVLAVGAALHQLVTGPLFSVVYRRILGISDDLVCPFGEIVQFAENVADLCIGEQRRLCKLVLCKLELGIGSGTALDRRLAELTP